MKSFTNYKCYFVMVLLSFLFRTNQAQYTTLQGKQFYDGQGQTFYPVICNYEMRFSCNNCNCGGGYNGSNCDTTDYELQPHYKYGLDGTYEHTFRKGIDKIKADFVKMKQMGFNTVRVMTLYFNENKHFKLDSLKNEIPDETGGRVICVKFNDAYNDGEVTWWGHYFKIDTPYTTNYNLQKIYLPKIKQLLDTAASVGINVIFVTGGQYISACGDVSKKYEYLANVYHEIQANDYAKYLKVLVNGLKNKTALMAYDLYNEAEWNTGAWDPEYGSFSPQSTGIKTEVCQFVSMWYDTIKATDTHHLVTMANGDIGGVHNYDPAILKLDFNCHHIYPFFFTQGFNSYNRQKSMDAFNAQLYWVHNVSPLPWVLGETGGIAWTPKGQDAFAQDTDNSLYSYTAHPYLVGTNLSQPPYGNVWGSFEDQDTFARWSQQAVLNFGGSGYAWWEFQDEGKKRPYGDTVPPLGGFFGLLKPGNPAGASPPYVYDTTLDKLLVKGAFSSNTPTTPNAPATMPFNYYNPYQGQYYKFSGRVVDQNGHPIKDAVVKGMNYLKHSKPKELWHSNDYLQFQLPRESAFNIFTFTREDGTFDLISPVARPFDSILHYPYNYGRFDGIDISAPASNIYWWSDSAGTLGKPIDTLIALYRQSGIFDDTVKNVTVAAPNSQTYTARHILVTQNIVVDSGATADFHASTEVVLLPGFEAKKGSNVQVYLAPVNFNCGTLVDGSGYHYKTDGSEAEKEVIPAEKSIEVHYSLDAPTIRLLPNPANNTVYLETDKSGSCTVEISTMTGSKIYSIAFYFSKKATLDVSSFAIGAYTVVVKMNTQTETFKLIINR